MQGGRLGKAFGAARRDPPQHHAPPPRACAHVRSAPPLTRARERSPPFPHEVWLTFNLLVVSAPQTNGGPTSQSLEVGGRDTVR